MEEQNGAPAIEQDAPVQAPNSPAKRKLEPATEAPEAPAAVDGSQASQPAQDEEPRQKKPKVDDAPEDTHVPDARDRNNGVALIKEEYLIRGPGFDKGVDDVDDDEAEGRGHGDGGGGGGGRKKGKSKGGQNKERTFGRSRDAIALCNSVAHSSEFSPKPCPYGEKCRTSHDLRQYLAEGRREDLTTFEGKCPVFAAHGYCPSGWKCRFVKSHMKEVEHEDGRKELVLIGQEKPAAAGVETSTAQEAEGAGSTAAVAANPTAAGEGDDARPDVVNIVPVAEKQNLSRRRTVLDKSEAYIKWLTHETDVVKKIYGNFQDLSYYNNENQELKPEDDTATAEDLRAQFTDPPFLPSEKRRIYFGPETPTLAPLTTQGNLPFRRLCVELGCEVTYSEMALCMDMVMGKQPEWALLKAHASEITPPRFRPEKHAAYAAPESYNKKPYIVKDYDHSKDLKFGVQVAASQPWMAIKATEAMARLLPHVRLIDMNCGCPIDMVYKTGGGCGLLESHNKLERMIRGMNAVSGEVPITAKLRIGVKDSSPCAPRVIERLAFGSVEARERLGAPGCAAITLHGRTRNQRYKKPADWSYIAECAALVKSYNDKRDEVADTVREPDARTLPNGADGHIYFLGNGDCYSHVQYREQIAQSGVDSVMIGRGALVKPWLFEEIEKGQYLDKSSTERLAYIEKFARYGMDCWGTDEFGLGMTRRFLLEYMGFASRYVPIGLLERLPPNLSDRPPQYRGRDDLETLLASRNYKDWIKISEMFLGPAHPDFKFVPKHKSSSYDEAEG